MADSGSESMLKYGQDEYFDWKCRVCEEEGLIKEATAYCKHCDECFCRPCFKYHERYNKSHAVLGEKEKADWGKSEQKRDTGISCSDHHGQTITMFCGLHDVLCCPVCVAIKHSDSCKPTISYIPDVAPGITGGTEFNAVINDTDSLMSSVKALTQERRVLKTKLNTSRRECSQNIGKFHKELAIHFNKIKAQSISEMNKGHDEMLQQVEEDLTTCMKLEQNLKEMKEQLNPAGSINESLMFVRMKNGLKSLPNYKDTIDRIAALERHTFKFIQSDSLNKYVCSTRLLGECVGVANKSLQQRPAKEQQVTTETDSNSASLASKLAVKAKQKSETPEKKPAVFVADTSSQKKPFSPANNPNVRQPRFPPNMQNPQNQAGWNQMFMPYGQPGNQPQILIPPQSRMPTPLNPSSYMQTSQQPGVYQMQQPGMQYNQAPFPSNPPFYFDTPNRPASASGQASVMQGKKASKAIKIVVPNTGKDVVIRGQPAETTPRSTPSSVASSAEIDVEKCEFYLCTTIKNNLSHAEHLTHSSTIIPAVSSGTKTSKSSKPINPSPVSADNDDQWSTTYQQDYWQPYPFCEPAVTQPTRDEIFTCFFADNKKLLVYTDNILVLKKKVDMKACGENVSGNGGGYLALEFGKKGGLLYQNAKKDSFAKCHRRNPGDVVVCEAGKMKCKFVAHVILPQGQDANDKDKMNSTFKKMFEAAVKHKCKTLALPLLGTGKARLQPEYVTKRLYESMKEFSISLAHHCQVLEVHLVNTEPDAITAIRTIQAVVYKTKTGEARPCNRINKNNRPNSTVDPAHSSWGANNDRSVEHNSRHASSAGYRDNKNVSRKPADSGQTNPYPLNKYSAREDDSDFSSDNDDQYSHIKNKYKDTRVNENSHTDRLVSYKQVDMSPSRAKEGILHIQEDSENSH